MMRLTISVPCFCAPDRSLLFAYGCFAGKLEADNDTGKHDQSIDGADNHERRLGAHGVEEPSSKRSDDKDAHGTADIEHADNRSSLHDSFQEFLYGCNEDFGLLFVWKVPAIGYNQQFCARKLTGKADALLFFDHDIVFTGHDERGD